MSANLRIDKYLQGQFPGLTRGQITEALETGLVLSPTGEKIKKGVRESDFDALNVKPLIAHLASLDTGNAALEVKILSETDNYWIVDKPAGIPSHPLSLFDTTTLTHWALARLTSIRSEFPDCQPTITPHRLDTGTSGIVIVAKNQKGFTTWRDWFSRKQVTKKYLAWCWGQPRKDHFIVDNNLAHHKSDARKMLSGNLAGGDARPPYLPARSDIKVVKQLADRCLVEVTCQTGVTHQVRVHCADLGFALIGDSLYDSNSAQRRDRPEWHLLRAISLVSPEGTFTAEEGAFRERYS